MQFAVALERVIAAPRSKVYRAWLDPALLARWMGPDDFSVTVATVDERVGGVHQVEMLDADGGHHHFVSVIEELVPDERIVFTFKFDPDGPGDEADDHVQRRRRRRHSAAPPARADHHGGRARQPVGQRRLGPDAGQAAGLLRELINNTTSTRRTTMNHSTGTRREWDDARRSLLEREKELTRMSDAVAQQRLELPWVRVDERVRVRHRGRAEELGRPVRRSFAADRLPLHVRPRLGRGLPELLVAGRSHRSPTRPPRAPRRRLGRRLAGPAREAAGLPNPHGMVVPVGLVVRQRLQLRLQGLLDRRAAVARVQLPRGARRDAPRAGRGSCRA